jgi:hypothetical protein
MDTRRHITKSRNMYLLDTRKEEESQRQRFDSKCIDHYWMCKMRTEDCNRSIENHSNKSYLDMHLDIAFLDSLNNCSHS